MSTTTKVTVNAALDDVVAALRDVHDEASLWRLSDEIVKVAPAGVAAVEAIVKEAKVRGIPTKSANTLRLYRDVAIRFPASERVALVSFSAHREAISVGDAQVARELLTELAAKHGPEGVTVTTVKDAISARTGKVKAAPVRRASSSAAGPSVDETITDLVSNKGGQLIAAITAAAGNGVKLDAVRAGLSSVLAHVEMLQAKQARKANVKPVAAGPAVSRKPVASGKPSVKPSGKASVKTTSLGGVVGKAGDLRDL
jgi:hypothetical protein